MTFSRDLPAIVVDASAAVWFLAGEQIWIERWREWARADAMLIVPPHFPIEVANALLRNSRLSGLETSTRLDHLYEAGFETADRALPGLLGAVELAERHKLTVYDALYLDLALDIDAELATLDRELAAAAQAEGVAVVG